MKKKMSRGKALYEKYKGVEVSYEKTKGIIVGYDNRDLIMLIQSEGEEGWGEEYSELFGDHIKVPEELASEDNRFLYVGEMHVIK